MGDYFPNSFQYPNVYADQFMHLLTGEEWKVLSCAVRHILGWTDKIESRRARISLSKFVDGFDTKNGHIHGTGLSKDTVRKCLASLSKYGLLKQTAENNAKNEGDEWELISDGSAVDLKGLQERNDATKEKTRTRTGKALQAANEKRASKKRVRRTMAQDTQSMSGDTVNGVSSDTGRTMAQDTSGLSDSTPAYYGIGTTNPIKPNSNPSIAPAAPVTSVDSAEPLTDEAEERLRRQHGAHELFLIAGKRKNGHVVAAKDSAKDDLWEIYAMSEDIRDWGRAFIVASGVHPTKKSIKDWIITFEEFEQFCTVKQFAAHVKDCIDFARIKYSGCARPGTIRTPLTEAVNAPAVFKRNLDKLKRELERDVQASKPQIEAAGEWREVSGVMTFFGTNGVNGAKHGN